MGTIDWARGRLGRRSRRIALASEDRRPGPGLEAGVGGRLGGPLAQAPSVASKLLDGRP